MKWDLDEIFAYKTGRYVRIRDKRLGLLNLFFVLLIVGYIGGYIIWFNKGYLAPADIVGTVRLQVQGPTAEYQHNTSQLVYCGSGMFPSVNGANMSFGQHPCEFLDEYDAVYPRSEESALLLSTRIKRMNYTLPDGCRAPVTAACAYQPVNTTVDPVYFVADAEAFTLWVDHTLNAPEAGISVSAVEMDGELTDNEGNKIDPCNFYTRRKFTCPGFIGRTGTTGHKDIFAMGSFLEAAGIAGLNTAAGDEGDLIIESRRYAGVMLLVMIDYDNYWSYDQTAVRYSYKVYEVKNTEFKVTETLPAAGMREKTRMVLDRHGLRLMFVQSGTIGVFRFQQLLVQLVSSLGLLAVASAAVNFMAFNLLPMQHIYKQYATVTSVDFSDISHLPKSTLARFRNDDLINPKPTIFEGVENDTDGGAANVVGGNERAKQLGKAPTQRHGGTAFGAMAAGARHEEDDEDEDALEELVRRQPAGTDPSGSAHGSRATRVANPAIGADRRAAAVARAARGSGAGVELSPRG